MALRWRQEPKATGLSAVVQGLRGFQLRDNGVIVIYVAPVKDGNRFSASGWYWYGCGQNTCANPVSTPEEAKAQAMAYYRDNYAKHCAD